MRAKNNNDSLYMSYQSSCDNLFPVPVGSIIFFSGTNIPFNYLLANGSSILRAEYPYLFEVIGTQFGSVDDEHFTLPNLITTQYIKGDDVVNPVPNASSSSTPASTSFTLTAGNLPSLSSSKFGVGSWSGTGNVEGTAVPHSNQIAPSGAVDSIIKADSSYDDYGATITGVGAMSITYSNTATAVTATLSTVGEFQPQNLGLLPCIRYNNVIPVTPITNDYAKQSGASSFYYYNI
jgi:microcystin-dependent protein